MKSIDLRVGLWEDSTGVYLRQSDLELLRTTDLIDKDDHIKLAMDDRTLCLTHPDMNIIFPQQSTALISPSGPQDLWPLRAWFHINFDELARCEITELKFNFNKDHTILFGILPPDHLMPWPFLKRCKGFDKSHVARREIRKRFLSARTYGVPFKLGQVPTWAQECLLPAERIAIYEGRDI